MKVNGIEIVNPSDVLVADGRVYSVRDLLQAGEITVQKVAVPFIANGRVYNIAEIEGGDTPGPGPEPGTKSKVKVVFHTGSLRPDGMVPHLTIDDFEIKNEYFPEHGYVLPVFSKTIYVENLEDIRFDGIRLINNWMEDYLRICVTHEDYPEYGSLTVGWDTREEDMPYETASDTVTERVRRLYIRETDSNIAIHFRQNETPGPGPEPEQDTYTCQISDSTGMFSTNDYQLVFDSMFNNYNANIDVTGFEQAMWGGSKANNIYIFKNGVYVGSREISNWVDNDNGTRTAEEFFGADGKDFHIIVTGTKPEVSIPNIELYNMDHRYNITMNVQHDSGNKFISHLIGIPAGTYNINVDGYYEIYDRSLVIRGENDFDVIGMMGEALTPYVYVDDGMSGTLYEIHFVY